MGDKSNLLLMALGCVLLSALAMTVMTLSSLHSLALPVIQKSSYKKHAKPMCMHTLRREGTR